MRSRSSLLVHFVAVLALASASLCTFAGGSGNPSNPLPDRWSAVEVAVLGSLRLSELPPAPKDPSNAVENSAAAINLGRQLFNDARFSRNGAVSCASCHDPALQFQDGLPMSRGVGTGTRRAMPIVGAGHSPWLFWDGRKDSLWSQARNAA